MRAQSCIVASSVLGLVMGHGYLVSPPGRTGGAAYEKTCGAAIAAQDKRDYTQEVQTLGRSPGPNCDLFLCKGYKFEDVPAANIQKYKLGESIVMKYANTIPHPMNDPTNVTIIDVKARVVAVPDMFFVPSLGSKVETLDLNVQMPKQFPAGKCETAGECVLALNWDAKDINQTFQSCVDFTLSK